MMNDLVLRGGSVLTPEGVVVADVGVSNGVIAALGTTVGEGKTTLDVTGCWVGPALVDIHTHLREPGQEWKEDVESGSLAAAAGGFGAVVAMPNTMPAIDAGHLARFIRDRGREVGLVDVMPSGCITLGRAGISMSHIDDLWKAGVRIFTDDGDSVANSAVLRSAMEYISALGGVVSQHAVDPDLSSVGHMHEGSVSSRLGMYGIPHAADDITLARDLVLAEMTGVRYHVQHLSTANGVELVREAKRRGVAVTAEVSPHHMAFDHTAVATTDSNFKVMPPLRESSDRQALIAGLVEGIIDAVATDHAPHAALEKEVPFEEAPNGMLGLEWAASIAIGVAALTQEAFFDRMSIRPAAIASLPEHGQVLQVGTAATIVAVDPLHTWTPTTTFSKSRNAPYIGMELAGKVRHTLLRGVVTFSDTPIVAGQ
ncbi:MAG: dihydroorotase [Actinomycetota bacterium]|nr:dihydroorotase [Actinomycetota bacterium]